MARFVRLQRRKALKRLAQAALSACATGGMTASIAAEPAKVVLLIRELRSDNGEIVPIREEIRQLLAYFERELRIRFEIRRYPWARLLNNAKFGEGLIFGLSKTRERQMVFQYSEAIYANYVWLVTRSDTAFDFNSIEDLQGKSVGVVRGSSYGDAFDRRRNILFHVEEDISSHASRLKKLLNRRMDVLLFGDRRTQAEEVDRYLHQIFAEEFGKDGSNGDAGFVVLPKPLLTDELHFAGVAPQFQVWLSKLDLAIQNGKKNGEIARILHIGN
ncbi:MAG: transporter substrate-binding domain-containing protein [Burkholderiales bacterium]|nr:transporter substrate-binding domain-containing protein [Burkholderiales bacterium]